MTRDPDNGLIVAFDWHDGEAEGVAHYRGMHSYSSPGPVQRSG